MQNWLSALPSVPFAFTVILPGGEQHCSVLVLIVVCLKTLLKRCKINYAIRYLTIRIVQLLSKIVQKPINGALDSAVSFGSERFY